MVKLRVKTYSGIELYATPDGENCLGHPRYKITRVDNGEHLGFVEGCDHTCETRSKGKRYVNSRWRSKRRYWRTVEMSGRTVFTDHQTIGEAASWLK